jgi:L-cysteine desulfidase
VKEGAGVGVCGTIVVGMGVAVLDGTVEVEVEVEVEVGDIDEDDVAREEAEGVNGILVTAAPRVGFPIAPDMVD